MDQYIDMVTANIRALRHMKVSNQTIPPGAPVNPHAHAVWPAGPGRARSRFSCGSAIQPRGLRFQAMERYVLRVGREGYERVGVLAAVRRASTLKFFELAGLRPGMRCADVGCGNGDATFELAKLVGPAGSVVGFDMDQAKLEPAHAIARERGLVTLPSS